MLSEPILEPLSPILLEVPKPSGLPFCRAFVMMYVHSESVSLVMDFCVNFLMDFLMVSCTFQVRTERIYS